eukprot:TRINITY_DN8467_c0_g1_i3.p1 TRINITY_DN8467_c0_g1~~TRINITY_DN8467_c0_g1_i3.p1  ORF type:complete len:391 (-),score=96.42 TRINITY_DN8467_c0_g1_i3:109-1281(-)
MFNESSSSTSSSTSPSLLSSSPPSITNNEEESTTNENNNSKKGTADRAKHNQASRAYRKRKKEQQEGQEKTIDMLKQQLDQAHAEITRLKTINDSALHITLDREMLELSKEYQRLLILLDVAMKEKHNDDQIMALLRMFWNVYKVLDIKGAQQVRKWLHPNVVSFMCFMGLEMSPHSGGGLSNYHTTFRMIPDAPWWTRFCEDHHVPQATRESIASITSSMHTKADIIFNQRRTMYDGMSHNVFQFYSAGMYTVDWTPPEKLACTPLMDTKEAATIMGRMDLSSNLIARNYYSHFELMYTTHTQIMSLLTIQQHASLLLRAYLPHGATSSAPLEQIKAFWSFITRSCPDFSSSMHHIAPAPTTPNDNKFVWVPSMHPASEPMPPSLSSPP